MTVSLSDEIISALFQIKAQKLPAACKALGLADGSTEDAFKSKRNYVAERIAGLNNPQLVELGERVILEHRTYLLEEALEEVKPSVPYKVDELTRRALIRDLGDLGALHGQLELLDFLTRIWPLHQMPKADEDAFNGCANASDSIFQHMVRNDDWTVITLLEFLGSYTVSDKRFGKLLELIVAPLVREANQQLRYATRLNARLTRVGLELRAVEEQAGYPVFRIVSIVGGVAGRVKNLIFAANGPKPELVLADAINNDIKIVKHEEFCLVFDEPIPSTGLLWNDVLKWWAKKHGIDPAARATAVSLYHRLAKSLASPPERLLFQTYFRSQKALGDRMPALIPQVYLHYDPYTQRQLGGVRRLVRQRMDFLLILSNFHRVVIEVDGKQHYAEDDKASPPKYAEMACADRELKMAGYDVFRFGGAELEGGGGEAVAASFFNRLFEKFQRA